MMGVPSRVLRFLWCLGYFWQARVRPVNGVRLLLLAVADGELAFCDRRVPALGVLRGWRRAITNVVSKVRSLD